ncbi:MAG: hypothetical protein M3326_09505, partial [Actinomycetota bacterium]|nr:hypothetical protein [Actinomycetota bacterium]
MKRALRVYRVILTLAFQAAKGKAVALFATAAVFGMAGAVTGLVTKLVVDALAGADPGRAMGIGIVYVVLTGVAALVDGVDVRELDLDDYRSRLAVIFQDFVRYQLP